MKLLGITQRVETVSPPHNERRDCLDQRWWDVAQALGFVPVPLPNVPDARLESFLEPINLSAILFSGGNSLGFLDGAESDVAFERDHFELNLIKWSLYSNVPIFGVCRGMQIINHYYGGSLKSVNDHVATRHTVTFCGRLSKESSREVNSFHNWSIANADLGEHLEPLALADDDTIEAFQHSSSRVAGIMWHPEREPKLNLQDIHLMKNFLL